MRKNYWNDESSPAPSSSVRAELNRFILEDAYDKHSNTFRFTVGCAGKRREVCEAGYLILLGLSNKTNASEAPQQWKSIKTALLRKLNGDLTEEHPQRVSYGLKAKSAVSYIDYCVDIQLCDTTPTAGNIHMFHNCLIDLKKNYALFKYTGMEKILVVPHETVSSYHREYVLHHAATGGLPGELAGLKTFQRVFYSMKDSIRLVRCKGAFNTCEVCNNANDLLRDSGIINLMVFWAFKLKHVIKNNRQTIYSSPAAYYRTI